MYTAGHPSNPMSCIDLSRPNKCKEIFVLVISPHVMVQMGSTSLGIDVGLWTFLFDSMLQGNNVSVNVKSQWNGNKLICQHILQGLGHLFQNCSKPNIANVMPTVEFKNMNCLSVLPLPCAAVLISSANRWHCLCVWSHVLSLTNLCTACQCLILTEGGLCPEDQAGLGTCFWSQCSTMSIVPYLSWKCQGLLQWKTQQSHPLVGLIMKEWCTCNHCQSWNQWWHFPFIGMSISAIGQ